MGSIGKKGKVFSLNRSKLKGVAKTSVDEMMLVEGFGVEGDAHAGGGLRQVSLLAIESIQRQKECIKVKKDATALKAGDFAENITTEGLKLISLKVGDKLRIGENVILKVSKIGKECHNYCAIYYKLGDCIMPREGIFAEVITGGKVRPGDTIEVII